jgi:teichuronic acid exporter
VKSKKASNQEILSLREKALYGFFWSFVDNFAKYGLTFIIGIFLARLLSPREFGLIGMVTIFIAISQSFVDSGFTQALIRRKNCSHEDYSTAFLFNLAVSFIFFALLFLIAPYIAIFFNEPQLTVIARVLALGLIVNALSITQRARLTRQVNFKLQTKISVLSSVLAGAVGIYMALTGYGVWSLVAKNLLGFAFTTILLWIGNKWIPSLVFNIKVFREMFKFGSRILLTGLIDTVYHKIFLLIIGKFYSPADLGFYTRADQFKDMPSKSLNTVIQRVSYPVLASIQDDIPRLKRAYTNIIQGTMFITFVLMIGLSAVAEPLIVSLIGVKWLPSVIMLQLLCFSGMLYPLHALNLNILLLMGKADLSLRLEIIKKMMAIPVILVGIFFGINALLIGMIISSFAAYFLNSYWSGKLISYSGFKQAKDILPSFLIALSVGSMLFVLSKVLNIASWYKLALLLAIGSAITLLFAETTRNKGYLIVKGVVLEKIILLKGKK